MAVKIEGWAVPNDKDGGVGGKIRWRHLSNRSAFCAERRFFEKKRSQKLLGQLRKSESSAIIPHIRSKGRAVIISGLGGQNLRVGRKYLRVGRCHHCHPKVPPLMYVPLVTRSHPMQHRFPRFPSKNELRHKTSDESRNHTSTKNRIVKVPRPSVFCFLRFLVTPWVFVH